MIESEEIPRQASDEELVTYVDPSPAFSNQEPVEVNSFVEDTIDDKTMLKKFANIQDKSQIQIS